MISTDDARRDGGSRTPTAGSTAEDADPRRGATGNDIELTPVHDGNAVEILKALHRRFLRQARGMTRRRTMPARVEPGGKGKR